MGLEILDGLSTGLRCSLKRSLSRRLVSPMYCFVKDCRTFAGGGINTLRIAESLSRHEVPKYKGKGPVIIYEEGQEGRKNKLERSKFL